MCWVAAIIPKAVGISLQTFKRPHELSCQKDCMVNLVPTSGPESPYDFQHGGRRRGSAEYFITCQTLDFRLRYTFSEINMVSIMQPNLILEKLYEDENQVPVM